MSAGMFLSIWFWIFLVYRLVSAIAAECVQSELTVTVLVQQRQRAIVLGEQHWAPL